METNPSTQSKWEPSQKQECMGSVFEIWAPATTPLSCLREGPETGEMHHNMTEQNLQVIEHSVGVFQCIMSLFHGLYNHRQRR